jgi:hypothetical protein
MKLNRVNTLYIPITALLVYLSGIYLTIGYTFKNTGCLKKVFKYKNNDRKLKYFKNKKRCRKNRKNLATEIPLLLFSLFYTIQFLRYKSLRNDLIDAKLLREDVGIESMIWNFNYYDDVLKIHNCISLNKEDAEYYQKHIGILNEKLGIDTDDIVNRFSDCKFHKKIYYFKNSYVKPETYKIKNLSKKKDHIIFGKSDKPIERNIFERAATLLRATSQSGKSRLATQFIIQALEQPNRDTKVLIWSSKPQASIKQFSGNKNVSIFYSLNQGTDKATNSLFIDTINEIVDTAEKFAQKNQDKDENLISSTRDRVVILIDEYQNFTRDKSQSEWLDGLLATIGYSYITFILTSTKWKKQSGLDIDNIGFEFANNVNPEISNTLIPKEYRAIKLGGFQFFFIEQETNKPIIINPVFFKEYKGEKK